MKKKKKKYACLFLQRQWTKVEEVFRKLEEMFMLSVVILKKMIEVFDDERVKNKKRAFYTSVNSSYP